MLTVRRATPDDAAGVAGVHVRSWQVAYRGVFPDDYLDGLRAEDRAALVAAGFRQAVLWVLAGNERAQRFHLADGWSRDGARREEVVWGVSADEVRYRRAVS